MSSTEKEEPGGSSFGEGFSLEQDWEELRERQPRHEGEQIGREGVKGGMAAHGRVLAVGAGQQVASSSRMYQKMMNPRLVSCAPQYSRATFSRHWVMRLTRPMKSSWLPLRYFQPQARASSMTRVMPSRPKKPTIC